MKKLMSGLKKRLIVTSFSIFALSALILLSYQNCSQPALFSNPPPASANSSSSNSSLSSSGPVISNITYTGNGQAGSLIVVGSGLATGTPSTTAVAMKCDADGVVQLMTGDGGAYVTTPIQLNVGFNPLTQTQSCTVTVTVNGQSASASTTISGGIPVITEFIDDGPVSGLENIGVEGNYLAIGTPATTSISMNCERDGAITLTTGNSGDLIVSPNQVNANFKPLSVTQNCTVTITVNGYSTNSSTMIQGYTPIIMRVVDDGTTSGVEYVSVVGNYLTTFDKPPLTTVSMNCSVDGNISLTTGNSGDLITSPTQINVGFTPLSKNQSCTVTVTVFGYSTAASAMIGN